MRIDKRKLISEHIRLRKIYEERAKKYDDKFSKDLAKSQRLAIKKLRGKS